MAFPSSALQYSSTSYLKWWLPSLEGKLDHNSWCVRVRSYKPTSQRLHQQNFARGPTIISSLSKQMKLRVEQWKVQRELLLQKRVKSVEPKEALRLQKENNFVILDVRPEGEFKKAHPPDAINVQSFRLIKGWTALDIAKRVVCAFYGFFSSIEENPKFIKSVEEKLNKNAKIIVACSAGGTMKPTQDLPQGKESISLKAAYLLVLNGYNNVFHLEGGLRKWFKEDLPMSS